MTELEEAVARFEAELVEVRRALEVVETEPELVELKRSIATWVERTEAIEVELFGVNSEIEALEVALRRATGDPEDRGE